VQVERRGDWRERWVCQPLFGRASTPALWLDTRLPDGTFIACHGALFEDTRGAPHKLKGATFDVDEKTGRLHRYLALPPSTPHPMLRSRGGKKLSEEKLVAVGIEHACRGVDNSDRQLSCVPGGVVRVAEE
jgi:hypothetical protein